jgi:hypothetical protein
MAIHDGEQMPVSKLKLWIKALLIACVIEVPALILLALAAQSESETWGAAIGWYHFPAFLILYKAQLHWEPLNGQWLPRPVYLCLMYFLQVMLTAPIVFSLMSWTAARRQKHSRGKINDRTT